MADKKRYQVVSAAVIVPVATDDGPIVHTLYRGSTFEGDPDNVRIAHNVDSGYIVELGGNAVAGVDAAGTPLVDDKPTVGDGNPGDPVFNPDPGLTNEFEHRKAVDAQAADRSQLDADGRWAAAEAKLPDGQKPDGRASEDVWRVYAVRQGMDRAEVEKASKADLQAALK